MKTLYKTFTLLAGLLVFVSCSKDDTENTNSDEKVTMTFGVSVSSDSEPSTRVCVNGLNLERASQDIIWEKDDKVTIFADNYSVGDEFKLTEIKSLGNTAVFTGKTHKNGAYYGLYPAQSSARLSYIEENGKNVGHLSFNIPNEQTATLNTFDPKAAIMSGKAETWPEGSTLALKHVCAYFSVTVGPGCESFIVEARSDAENPAWYLAGNVTAEVTSASTKIKSLDTSKCQSKITLTGDALKTGGTFLIPFIPSTKCPKIFAKATFYPNTDRFDQPDKTFTPKNSADEDAKYQFVAGYIYELGTFVCSK